MIFLFVAFSGLFVCTPQNTNVILVNRVFNRIDFYFWHLLLPSSTIRDILPSITLYLATNNILAGEELRGLAHHSIEITSYTEPSFMRGNWGSSEDSC